jgi:hypothetical protein
MFEVERPHLGAGADADARLRLLDLGFQHRDRPSVQNKGRDRIKNSTSDQEQHHPNQTVDLLLEIGHRLRCLLRLPREYGSQEENDGYRSQNDAYQLKHIEMPPVCIS